MTPTRFDEESIFQAARKIEGPEARGAYLDRACGPDRGLRGRLDALLRAYDQERSFLEAPAVAPPPGATAAWPPHPPEGSGSVIGPYKLLEAIGEGGMGAVYMAEQTHPVRRKVALKVIKPGMDTRQVIARFEAERQALALMDHPNIARVLDAGATESGRPYFVMELVRGIPITDYCDRARLPIPARLGLFVQVCQAVQHAHQKGVIHRDLKPSNVLVTLHDGVPVPKVIDFGIAKATGQSLTDKTLFTGFAQLVGTPLYMSPEQAEMSGLDVDTRSDVYSLGVLLYELLTGTTPFDREMLGKAAFDEVRRIIREQEPPTPSTRLSALGATLTDVSTKRGSDPRRLGKVVRGELDWIVMKALEKDRNRRYETASGLAADVRRYLDDEPVQACPPSAWYRLSKAARRNRVALVTTAVVATALVLGTGVSTWQAVRATRAEQSALRAEAAAGRERDRAVAAEGRASGAARKAQTEASISKAINDFLLKDLLAEAAPNKNAREHRVTVEEILHKAAAGIAGKFDSQPEVEAAIRYTVAATYLALGLYEQALPHAERALELRRRVLGPDHPHTLKTISLIGELHLSRRSRGSSRQAESLIKQLLEAKRRVLGPDHPDTLLEMNNLAAAYEQQGQYEKAEPLYTQVLEIQRRVLRPDCPETLETMNNLAVLYAHRGQYEKAEPLYLQALEVDRRVLGPEHRYTLSIMDQLGRIASEKTNASEEDRSRALEMARQAVEQAPERNLGWKWLAVAEYCAGNWDAAIQATEKCNQLRGDQGYCFQKLVLALSHARRGDMKEARVWYAKVGAPKRSALQWSDTPRRLIAEAEALLGPAELPDDVFAPPGVAR